MGVPSTVWRESALAIESGADATLTLFGTNVFIGAATGGVIAATNSYHHGLSALPIILGLVGAGVGYAVDDNLSVDTLVYSSDIEVMQKNASGNFDTYRTTITVSGQQLNMDKMDATGQMFEHVSEGLAQLISH